MTSCNFGGWRRFRRTPKLSPVGATLAAAILLSLAHPAFSAVRVEVDIRVTPGPGVPSHPCTEEQRAKARESFRDLLEQRWPLKVWDFVVAQSAADEPVKPPAVMGNIELGGLRARVGFIVRAANGVTETLADGERRTSDCESISKAVEAALTANEADLLERVVRRIQVGLGAEEVPGSDSWVFYAPPEVALGVFRFKGYPTHGNEGDCHEQEAKILFKGTGCRPMGERLGVVVYRQSTDPPECGPYVDLKQDTLSSDYFYLVFDPSLHEGELPRSCGGLSPVRATPGPTSPTRTGS